MATYRTIKIISWIYKIILHYCSIKPVHYKMQSQSSDLEIFFLRIYSHISNFQL